MELHAKARVDHIDVEADAEGTEETARLLRLILHIRI